MNCLERNNFPLQRENVVTIGLQPENEMAQVAVNGKCFMLGNYWDFHPGCHGHDFDFSGVGGLARTIATTLEEYGYKADIVIDKTWKYD